MARLAKGLGVEPCLRRPLRRGRQGAGRQVDRKGLQVAVPGARVEVRGKRHVVARLQVRIAHRHRGGRAGAAHDVVEDGAERRAAACAGSVELKYWPWPLSAACHRSSMAVGSPGSGVGQLLAPVGGVRQRAGGAQADGVGHHVLPGGRVRQVGAAPCRPKLPVMSRDPVVHGHVGQRVRGAVAVVEGRRELLPRHQRHARDRVVHRRRRSTGSA